MPNQETVEKRPFGLVPYNKNSGVYLSAIEIIAKAIEKSGFRPLVCVQADDTVFQGGHAHFASGYWRQRHLEGRLKPELLFDESFVFLHELEEIIRNRQANKYDDVIARFDSRFQAYFFGFARFGAHDPVDGHTRSMWDFRRERREGSTQITLPYYSIDIRYKPSWGIFKKRPNEYPKAANITAFNTHHDPSPPNRYGELVRDIGSSLEEDGFLVRWKEQDSFPAFSKIADPMADVNYGPTLPDPRFGHWLVAK